jgi:hypothetical protein
VNRRYNARPGSEQGHRVWPRAVGCGTEDDELAAADLQHAAVVVINLGVIVHPGQQIRIVRASRLDDCDLTARRREDFHPAVVTDYPVCADHSCASAADPDRGVLRAEFDDPAELVVAEAVPSITKCGVDSEERFTVCPQSANVHPPVAHELSIAVTSTPRRRDRK